jgi:short-subunit dehydrogenase
MKLQGARVVLTGAAGGIGRALALALAARGAHLALVGRDTAGLLETRADVERAGVRAAVLPFDLAAAAGHAELIEDAQHALGGLDILINNAGVGGFARFEDQSAAAIAAMVAVNLTAPMLLARAALRSMLSAAAGKIVNVGSGFGAVGFPHFSAYSATKFGLRGFSEALRRELADTGVSVCHVAPRGTRTTLNSPAQMRFAQRVRMALDDPADVAVAIVAAIERDAADVRIGAPERLFGRVNALLPRLLDGALAGQARVAREVLHDEGSPGAAASRSG